MLCTVHWVIISSSELVAYQLVVRSDAALFLSRVSALVPRDINQRVFIMMTLKKLNSIYYHLDVATGFHVLR